MMTKRRLNILNMIQYDHMISCDCTVYTGVIFKMILGNEYLDDDSHQDFMDDFCRNVPVFFQGFIPILKYPKSHPFVHVQWFLDIPWDQDIYMMIYMMI